MYVVSFKKIAISTEEEEFMKKQIIGFLGVIVAAILGGPAGRPAQYQMQQPGAAQTPSEAPPPQTVTFPNGTVFGGASANQASSLAQIMGEAKNNNMKEYGSSQGTENT